MNLAGLPRDVRDKIVQCLDMYNQGKMILLVGETGVGKSFLAREFHRASKWRNGKFVHIDLSSMESELFESELFGYENGAFTGARKYGKLGVVDQAQGGTLFFDEIGNLDLRFQKKFLIFLEERRYRRLGGNRYIELKAGFIFATNIELNKAISQGLFRKDLYYRISNCVVEIPPLRERVDDLENLINYLVLHGNLRPISFSKKAMVKLKEYIWPGNIRELMNYLVYWNTIGLNTVNLEDLPEQIRNYEDDFNFKKALNNFKKDFLVRILKISNWSVNEAARRMKISRQYLYRMIKQLGIKIPESET